jgi:hypothetical protein
MVGLPILHGYCTIELVERIGGSRHHPTFGVCGNVLVDERNFRVFNQHQWLKSKNKNTPRYYAYRRERKGGKRVHVIMAREVMGLPRGSGRGSDVADHKNHDTRDNTLENLRVATYAQNAANGIVKRTSGHRFKGIGKNKYGGKYRASVSVNGLRGFLPSVPTDIEAGLMYWYADIILHGEFSYNEGFPSDEMPTLERQKELLEMVVEELRKFGVSVGEWELPIG